MILKTDLHWIEKISNNINLKTCDDAIREYFYILNEEREQYDKLKSLNQKICKEYYKKNKHYIKIFINKNGSDIKFQSPYNSSYMDQDSDILFLSFYINIESNITTKMILNNTINEEEFLQQFNNILQKKILLMLNNLKKEYIIRNVDEKLIKKYKWLVLFIPKIELIEFLNTYDSVKDFSDSFSKSSVLELIYYSLKGYEIYCRNIIFLNIRKKENIDEILDSIKEDIDIYLLTKLKNKYNITEDNISKISSKLSPFENQLAYKNQLYKVQLALFFKYNILTKEESEIMHIESIFSKLVSNKTILKILENYIDKQEYMELVVSEYDLFYKYSNTFVKDFNLLFNNDKYNLVLKLGSDITVLYDDVVLKIEFFKLLQKFNLVILSRINKENMLLLKEKYLQESSIYCSFFNLDRAEFEKFIETKLVNKNPKRL